MNTRISELMRGISDGCCRKGQALNRALLVIFYLLPLGCGIIDGGYLSALSVIYILGIVYFSFYKEFVCLYPLFFLFYSQLIAPGGIVVYRVYTIVFIIRTLLSLVRRRPSLSLARGGILLLLALSALVLRIYGYPLALGAAIDICFACCFLFSFDGDDGTVSEFFVFFTFGVVISAVSGFLLSSISDVIASENGADVLRYSGTLEDPNYFGFFLNAAIAVVFLHPFFKRLPFKLVSLCVLFLAILASGSTTALLCSIFTVAVCSVFLMRMKRFKLGVAVTVIVIAVIAIQLLMLAQDSEWTFISTASARWQEKLGNIASGDLSEFTTLRVDIWKENLQKFSEQSVFQKLFGGNYITAVGYDESRFTSVSHQEYLDIMLCMGVFGLMFFLCCTFFTLREAFSNIKRAPEIGSIRVVFKLIWLFYGFVITMFLNTRFYILFLI